MLCVFFCIPVYRQTYLYRYKTQIFNKIPDMIKKLYSPQILPESTQIYLQTNLKKMIFHGKL